MERPPVVTRAEAMSIGLKRYFTGTSCSHGHVAERLCSNYKCVICGRREVRAYEERNKEMVRAKQKQYRIKHAAETAEFQRAYRAKNKPKAAASQRAWRLANKDTLKRKKAAWAKAHAEEMRAWRNAWRQRNSDKIRAFALNRIARKRNAPGNFTAADVAVIAKMQGGKCAYCRAKLKSSNQSTDHHIPLFKGGSNWPRNLQVVCAICNSSKGARDPIEFAQSRGLLR